MCYTKLILLYLGLLGLGICSIQEDFTGYFQAQIARRAEVKNNYSHNFSLAQRNFIYKNSDLQLKTGQLDLTPFSKVKIRNNKSLALGIQYRFRQNFEPDKKNELHLTQQYSCTSKARIASIGHRLRTEQRLTKSLTTHRFAIDFTLNGEQLDVREAYLVATTESLLSTAIGEGSEYE